MKPFLTLFFALLFFPLCAEPAPDLTTVKTEDLIDQLQLESNQGIGTDSTAWAEGFMAINEVPRFTGGIIGSRRPTVSPVMKELVRRGLGSLPLLIQHLSDARPTHLIVGKGAIGKWFADEFDSRYSDPARQPHGVNTPAFLFGDGKTFDLYTVKVGDLCFVAVGQIVNRHYAAVRYQPSMCLVVNSPVEIPNLAAAVKFDWTNLTPEDHRDQLTYVSTHPLNPYNWPEALKRLIFYYPESGMPLAEKLIDRPLYENSVVSHFVYKTLFNTVDPHKQDALKTSFLSEQGPTNDAAVELRLIQWSNQQNPGPREKEDDATAGKLLARLYPNFKPTDPYPNVTDFYDQKQLLDAVATFHSDALDQAAYRELLKTAAMHPDDVDDIFARCELVDGLLSRLTKSDQADAFQKSYKEVMSHFPRTPETQTMDAFSKRFDGFLSKELTALAPK